MTGANAPVDFRERLIAPVNFEQFINQISIDGCNLCPITEIGHKLHPSIFGSKEATEIHNQYLTSNNSFENDPKFGGLT